MTIPVSTSARASPWLLRPAPHPAANVRLFCLPYAGGNAFMFRSWAAMLPSTIEVVALQLPGRGGHLHAKPFTRLTSLVEALVEELIPLLDKPFAFFGHSMGAMLGFEASRLLRRQWQIEPVHLFVSGRRAPQVADDTPPTYALPDDEFIAELRRLKGTPQAVLENDELMALMVPVLRADFGVCQTYVYGNDAPLGCPITAFSGMRDEDETAERMAPWREQTTSTFALKEFPGDHFFLNAAAPRMLAAIGRSLQDAVPGRMIWRGPRRTRPRDAHDNP